MVFFSEVAVYIQEQDYGWYWALFHSALLGHMLAPMVGPPSLTTSASMQQEKGDSWSYKTGQGSSDTPRSEKQWKLHSIYPTSYIPE